VRSIYVVLIRHAPTAWNEEGRVIGQADPPLSAAGLARAADWRLPPDLRALAAAGELGWATSPLRRAVETARTLGAVDPIVEPRLAEQDCGAWTGQARAAVEAGAPSAGWDTAPPGGESPARVLARVGSWLAELAPAGGPATWAAVTHMGVIRTVVGAALRWDLAEPPPMRLLPDRLHRVRRRGDGLLQLIGLNEPLKP